MANLSLRGLDAPTLDRIRAQARRLGLSVNRLIVDTLQRQYGSASRRRDQIDELAGTWTRKDAEEFEEAIRPLSTIDPELWASEPKANYRISRPRRRKQGARRGA